MLLTTLSVDVVVLQPITHLSKRRIRAVAAGSGFTFALTSEGELYGWGTGRDVRDAACLAEPLLSLRHCSSCVTIRRAMACGGDHGCIIAAFCRANWESETRAIASYPPSSSPSARTLCTVASRWCDCVTCRRRCYAVVSPTVCVCVGTVVQVSCGSRHTAAVSTTGKVLTWGEGHYGQLGHDDTASRAVPTVVASLNLRRVAQVCAMARGTACLTDNNELIAWGMTSR